MILVLMIMGGNIHASGYLHTLWTGTLVQSIHSYDNQIVIKFVEHAPHNPDGCDVTYMAYINDTSKNYSQVLTIALAAQASGKKLGVWSRKCSVIPFWGGTNTVPHIDALWIVE